MNKEWWWYVTSEFVLQCLQKMIIKLPSIGASTDVKSSSPLFITERSSLFLQYPFDEDNARKKKIHFIISIHNTCNIKLVNTGISKLLLIELFEFIWLLLIFVTLHNLTHSHTLFLTVNSIQFAMEKTFLYFYTNNVCIKQ